MSTYIELEEQCGNEGEDWTTYLVEEGNEPFIEKLKATLEKYPDVRDRIYDSGFCIGNENVDANTVEVLVSHTKSGYYDFTNRCDKILSPDLIDDSSEDDFVESFYKRGWFR